jgi:hypothetical protein
LSFIDVTKKIDTKIVAVTLPESALENGKEAMQS